jgi:hypothetical protein
MVESIWGYGPESEYRPGGSLAGYAVEATDGHIGKVDKHSDEVNEAYLVVDTGVWIFGKHVLLPAGTIRRVDAGEEKVYLSLTKEQIKDSPEFDRDKHTDDPAYRQEVGEYYNPGGPVA